MQTAMDLIEHCFMSSYMKSGPSEIITEGLAAGPWRFLQYYAHRVVLYTFHSVTTGLRA